MSADEFRKLMSGEVLVNDSTHPFNRTLAVGFCFTADNPDDAIHWLSGQVDADYCVTMEPREGLLTKAKAEYRDTSVPLPPLDAILAGGMQHHRVVRTEYCTTRYSKADVKILNVTRKYSHLRGIKATRAIMALAGSSLETVDKSKLKYD